jgi:hypothetical protein
MSSSDPQNIPGIGVKTRQDSGDGLAQDQGLIGPMRVHANWVASWDDLAMSFEEAFVSPQKFPPQFVCYTLGYFA